MRLWARGMVSGLSPWLWISCMASSNSRQWGDNVSHKATASAWLDVWSAPTSTQWPSPSPGAFSPCRWRCSPLPLLSHGGGEHELLFPFLSFLLVCGQAGRLGGHMAVGPGWGTGCGCSGQSGGHPQP